MGSSQFAVSGPATGPRWQTALLEQPGRGDHIALVYQKDAFLVESVARFIDSGLRAGDGIVVLCTLPRWEGIRQRLAYGGASVEPAVRRGQLMRTGVHNVLLSWMSDDCTQAAFNLAVGFLVDIQLAQYAAVRVFSELADVLLEKKDSRLIATNAQRAWNSYLRGKPASVLSPWREASLDAEYGARLEHLYLTHKHILTDHSDEDSLDFTRKPGPRDALAR